MPEPDAKTFDGTCPWCGLAVDAGLKAPAVPASRRCPCGAVAFAAAKLGEAVAAAIKHYGISPSAIHGDIHAGTDWMKDFSIAHKEGGRGVASPQAPVVSWHWFLRKLPWDKPAGPMTDRESLDWLTSQGEKFYDLMYESRRPSNEYREAKEAFQDAIAMARKMGLAEEAERLAKRLAHIRDVYIRQFSGF